MRPLCSALPVPLPTSLPVLCYTYQADAPDAGIDPRTQWGISRLLSEEEVELVIIPLAAVRDELGTDKGWVWNCTAQHSTISPVAPLLYAIAGC